MSSILDGYFLLKMTSIVQNVAGAGKVDIFITDSPKKKTARRNDKLPFYTDNK